MAEELRMIKGDTYDIVVTIRDRNNALVDIGGGGWIVAIESETINKNSSDSPIDFMIEQPPYGKGVVVIGIISEETAGRRCGHRDHFKIKIYKNTLPIIVKTVATGDLFFIDEA
jgi:hypothetical protein